MESWSKNSSHRLLTKEKKYQISKHFPACGVRVVEWVKDVGLADEMEELILMSKWSLGQATTFIPSHLS